MVTKDTFSTVGQYNKYLRLKSFFENLIKLHKNGYFFMTDSEIIGIPYIDEYEMGFVDGKCRVVFVGSSFCENKETGEFDIPWIDISIKELKERIIPLKRAKL